MNRATHPTAAATNSVPVRARRRAPHAAALCTGLWLLVVAAAGQEVHLRAASRTAYVDEPLTVEVEVRDFQQCQSPQFPDSDAYEVRLVGAPAESTFVSIVNGRRSISHSRTYVYELTPLRTGPLTIGPVEVEVDGRRLRSNTIEVVVRKGDRPIEAEIATDAPRLFVGQQARFVLTLRIRPVEVAGVPLRGGQMYSFVDPRHAGLGPFPPPRSFERVRRRAADGTQELWYQYTLSTQYVVQRVGPVHFDDLELTVRYPTRLSRDLFGDLRAEGYRLIRLRPKIQAPPVEPLPEQGRPALFSGAVGRFQIAAHASPTRVHVGDPIELVIEITGDGPLKTLAGPDLSAQPRLVRDFRVPDEPLAGKIVGRRKRFTQTIRARRADVREIPPIEFAFFDPVEARYRVVRSLPIPIQVAAAASVTAGDIEGLKAARASPTASLRRRPGMREIRTDARLLLARTPEVTPAQVVASLVLPPAGLGVLMLGVLLRRGHGRWPAVRRRVGARYVRTLERLATSRDGHAEQIHDALLGYLSERLGMPAGRRTAPDVLAALRDRGVADELLEQARTLLERCEQARYGGIAADGSLAGAARKLIERLERQRW